MSDLKPSEGSEAEYARLATLAFGAAERRDKNALIRIVAAMERHTEFLGERVEYWRSRLAETE